ncbi:MAG: hypothetical protein L0H94_13020 [Nitrospira sp.]|nr:hypothetical protein [Nitrospira sp.]
MKTGVHMLVMSFVMAGLVAMSGVWASAHAAIVTQVDFTNGATNWGGRQGRILDRLFGQEGTLEMGQYQSWGEIVDPIEKGHKTYSLFTSNLLGAPAPSGTIEGMSITLDLSSLFLGWQRGDEIHAWNIGGTAKGLFNPQTSEFQLSWDHLFKGSQNSRMQETLGAFFLQGSAMVGTPAAVPIAASGLLFGSGLIGLGSWSWLKRRGQALGSA